MNTLSPETIVALREVLGIEPGDPANADDLVKTAVRVIALTRVLLHKLHSLIESVDVLSAKARWHADLLRECREVLARTHYSYFSL